MCDPDGVGGRHGMPILTRFARSDAQTERPYILDSLCSFGHGMPCPYFLGSGV